ncbi:MAG: DNA polymerase II [Desulfobacterales bacterium]
MDVFLLTGDFRDENGRCAMEFYGRSTTDRTIRLRFPQAQVVFFVERNASLPAFEGLLERREVNLSNEQLQPVDALYFDTWQHSRRASQRCLENHISIYEGDVRPTDRFLMERFIYGGVHIDSDGIDEDKAGTIVNPRLVAADVSTELSSLSFDIETDRHHSEVYSIAWDFRAGSRRIQQVVVRGEPAQSTPTVSMVDSETALLSAFIDALKTLDPDLLLGWHVEGFDLRVLQNLADRCRMPLALGRGGRPVKMVPLRNDQYRVVVPGRVVIDGPTALRQNFFTYENYSLDAVAQLVLDRGKLIEDQNDSGESKVNEIDRLFADDKPALARYNLEDCVLVTDILDKVGLITMMQRRVQLSGMLLDHVGRSTAAFDHLMLPRYHREGFVAPDVRSIEVREHAAGGYVMDPEPGLYHRTIVLDFKSLYPSLIRTFKIDPLSRLLADEKGISVPNGIRFSRTRSILPEMIETLMQRRAEAKDAKDQALSQAIKILMNSFYGVMGSGGCRFYHPDLPTAITSTGKWLLIESRSWLEARGYRVLYGDTDSIFVEIPESHSDWQAEGPVLADTLNGYWKDRLHDEFDVDSILEFEFEKAYAMFFLPAVRGGQLGAKKRYAGLRVNVDTPVVEIVGLEAVRSDWTPMARAFQRELFQRLFDDRPLISWMKAWVKALHRGDYDDRLTYTKRLRKPLAEYTRSTPPHVKAARLMASPGRRISYVMTHRGPMPLERNHVDIDYTHYIDRQIRPIADQVLALDGQTFNEDVLSKQLKLF